LKQHTDLLMCLNLLLISSALAQEGKFTFVGEGEPAPFEGVLLDPVAAADVLSKPSELQQICEIKTQYKLEVQATEYDLLFANKNAELEALQKEHEVIITEKDQQIVEYEKVIEKHSPHYRWLWFAGGVAGGIGLSYAAYETLNE